ncbi:MAG: hypothetical protein ABIP51_06960 [Bacteroidia bacterium]
MKFIFYFLFIAGTITAQTTQKIKFQKTSNLIYFFLKNNTKDSVLSKTNDLFYFVVPDSLKKTTVVFIENGQLLKTSNDSIVRLNYMPGLKYESQFVINEIPQTGGSKSLKREFNMISLINGATASQKNKINIQVVNKKEDKVLIENSFFYKD